MSLIILNDASFEQLARQHGQHGEEFIRNIGFRTEHESNELLHKALERAAKEKMEQDRRIVELGKIISEAQKLLNDYHFACCPAAEECTNCGIDNCALKELEALLRGGN